MFHALADASKLLCCLFRLHFGVLELALELFNLASLRISLPPCLAEFFVKSLNFSLARLFLYECVVPVLRS